MQEEDVLSEFRASQALLEGHFLLSSGRHSAFYLQCARVLMDPMRAARLATATAQKLPRDLRQQIQKVVSPAMGGVIIGHEMGRALGVEALFVERPTGTFELRRGFTLQPGEKVLMVEDVVTTGLSSREAIKAIEAAGGEVIAAAALVDRSAGAAIIPIRCARRKSSRRWAATASPRTCARTGDTSATRTSPASRPPPTCR